MGQSNFGGRLVYANARKGLIDAGLDANAVKSAYLSQSYLRFETQVNTTSNVYTFPVLNNQTFNNATQRPTEKRLNLQDAFYISEVGVYLARPTSATVYNYPLYTYPSPGVFSTAGESAALQTLYNGSMYINVNNVVITPAYDLQRFNVVPFTQGGVGITAQTVFPIDEFHGNDNTSIMEPNVVFIGSKNTQLQINLPAAVGTVASGGSIDLIVIIFRGLLAQNVTVVS